MDLEVRQQRPIERFLLLGALTAIGPLAIDLYVPALPQIATSLHVGASTAQLTLTTYLVALGVGQLITGPASDRWGRRGPLLVGLATFAIASVLCALVHSIALLIAMRLIQGLAGASGAVLARAMVRDLYSGREAARYFSLLYLILGVSPIFAPFLGGELLLVLPWEGLFACLALLGGALFVAILLRLEETLPPERRATHARHALRELLAVLGDRNFMRYAIVTAASTASIFTYVATSSFVFQGAYAVSTVQYGLIFGLNGFGLIVASQVNARLVRRVAPHRILVTASVGRLVASFTLLFLALHGHPSLFAVLAPLFVVIAANGFVGPNGVALAMQGHPQRAGSASALLGLLQFGAGGLVAPLAGSIGVASVLPMAAVIAVGTTLSAAALVI